MQAIVEIAAQQFKVKNADVLTVPLLAGNPGDAVEFANILSTVDGESIRIGAPYVSGSVKATIVEHGKGEKILVFKKKRRKGYQKCNGHRQNFTTIKITNINLA